ncbi:hypothetical protein TrVE_jg1002 [Triparma verrucosa]|uniref:ABC-2 type transporter transmembrane domain-containing protein n=1 Tax=Triparma verrucosa TaxID=1606542 RepID=A0A9W7BIW8_9STRA|nr:hypothetical protein TrVE_jg1002 [Triparma verrucosa]
MLETFNLKGQCDTLIGNDKIRGISGGELKRLTILLSIILPKSYLFLDEPYSGLDSYSSSEIKILISKIVEGGTAVVVVTHDLKDISGEIWCMSSGRIVYKGTSKNVSDYFSKKDVKGVTNFEEFMEEATKGIEIDYDGEWNVRSDGVTTVSSDVGIFNRLKPRSGFLRQTRILLGRSFKEAWRSRGSTIIKSITQVSIALIYGTLYHINNNQASIYDRFGLLSLVSIGTLNLSLAGTLRAFPKERVRVKKEQKERLFSVIPYFISKAISSLPITASLSCLFGSIVYPLTGLNPSGFKSFLGLLTMHSITSESLGLLISSLSGSEDKALAFFGPLTVLQVIFDGRNLSYENTPKVLRWLQGISLVRLNWQSLVINEFKGLKFNKDGRRGKVVIESGEEAVKVFGIEGGVGERVGKQIKFVGICWGMAIATMLGGGGFIKIKGEF